MDSPSLVLSTRRAKKIAAGKKYGLVLHRTDDTLRKAVSLRPGYSAIVGGF
jgi:hypothetical protein